MVSDRAILSVAEAASWQAWFKIGRADLCLFAAELEIPIEPGSSLIDILSAMIKATLYVGDDTLGKILYTRLARLNTDCTHSSAIFEMDGALEA